eukprot:712092_1
MPKRKDPPRGSNGRFVSFKKQKKSSHICYGIPSEYSDHSVIQSMFKYSIWINDPSYKTFLNSIESRIHKDPTPSNTYRVCDRTVVSGDVARCVDCHSFCNAKYIEWYNLFASVAFQNVIDFIPERKPTK